MLTTLLAAEEVSWIRSLVDAAAYGLDKLGWPGLLIFLGIAALIWYARTYGPDHREEIKSRTTVLKLLIEHVPKQTQCNTDTVRVLEKLTDHSSDVIREVAATSAKVDELAVALVEHGCPDSREVLAARLAPHVERHQKRKEEMKREKPEHPPGFGQPATG